MKKEFAKSQMFQEYAKKNQIPFHSVSLPQNNLVVATSSCPVIQAYEKGKKTK